jgi:hypothetical protein
VATAVVAAVGLVRADGSWHQGPDHGDHVRGPASAHHD